MQNQILKQYLIHLVPAILLPVGAYYSDRTLPPLDLFELGLLFPLWLLATRGLASFFHVPYRSTATLVEHAILRGLVFAAYLVFLNNLFVPNFPPPSVFRIFLEFSIPAIVMAIVHFAISYNERKKIID
jgi:hypothetical protein